MTFRQSPLLLLFQVVTATVLVTALVSCGTQDNPTLPIIVTFSQGFAPPATLNTGAYAGIAVTVANDPKNAGASVSCTPVGACGTFVGPGGGNGIPFCYLAPDAVPPGNKVTITATSVADTTKFVSGIITIVNGPPNPCP